MRKALPLLLFAAMLLLPTWAQTGHSVTLVWSWAQGAGDMATGFHVLRSNTAGGPYATVGTVPVGTLTFTDSTVVAGRTFFYTVTAFDSAGDSAPGNEVQCTIPFSPPTSPTGVSATVK